MARPSICTAAAPDLPEGGERAGAGPPRGSGWAGESALPASLQGRLVLTNRQPARQVPGGEADLAGVRSVRCLLTFSEFRVELFSAEEQ